QKAREIVQTGQLGDIRLITEQLVTGAGLEGFRAAGFVHYPKGGPGGGMMGLCDHGVHFLDIIPWIVGSPIAKVSGLGNISGAAPTPETAMLRLKNGALGILTYDEATYSSDLPNEGIFSGGQDWITGEGFGGHIGEWAAGAPSFRIHGSKGALRVFHYGYKLFIHDQDGLREIALPTAAEANHFFYQMQAFVDTIQGKREVPAGIDEGLAGVRALLALYESQSKEAWISL
ncbi:MAG: Gfo/Idh/MocA family oxidoreductase, partial [Pseudomonadota bacterium]